MKNILIDAGIEAGQHLLIHSSFRRIKKAYPSLTINSLITILQDLVTQTGSIIMPSFTYNWMPVAGTGELYNKLSSPSKTGMVSEVFRQQKDVIRTSSPTHSFLLWGKVTGYIFENNSPVSPLGKGSALDWLSSKPNSYILLLGTDFTSMSYLHYIEIKAEIPWFDYSPWSHMNITEYGISVDGKQKLNEIPGCSKSFVNFEEYLFKRNLLNPVFINDLRVILIPVSLLLIEGVKYFKENYLSLLCASGTCLPCDNRRNYYNNLRRT